VTVSFSGIQHGVPESEEIIIMAQIPKTVAGQRDAAVELAARDGAVIEEVVEEVLVEEVSIDGMCGVY
jgi:mycofactocin precursor